MTFVSRILALPLLLLPFAGAQAAPQDPIGSAVVVVNMVTAELEQDTRTLATGDKVHEDETIDVAADASSEFKLDDDTKLALGPGSHLKLDKFVYDPAKTKGSIVLDLVKGSFRFMTGVAQKPTYVIKTPSAAITVRGTIFDVYVQDDGLAWLLLHEGAVQICNSRGKCQDLTEPGKLIRITSDGDVGAPVKWAGLEGKDSVPFDTAFPFVSKTPSIDPDPIFTRDVIILGNLPTPDKPKNTDETKPPKRTDKGDSRPTKKAETKKKPTKTAKRNRSDDDSNIVSGMDIAIGVGGFGRGGHMGGGRGGSDGGGRGSTGGSMGGGRGK